MVRLHNPLRTDAWREIRNTFPRFLSLLVLSALAVAFLIGLRATAPHMEYTADRYYDTSHLMDGYILSTMGITDEDIAALSKADGVEAVEGAYFVDAIAVDSVVSLRSMPESLNFLTVKEGRLPQTSDECVTEKKLLDSLGLSLGDTITFTAAKGEEDSLTTWTYTIVGTVTTPLYVGTDRGTTSLGNGSVDAFVYLPRENFDRDVYSIAYFTGEELAALDSYGDAYDTAAETLLDSLDDLATERASLRDTAVRQEITDTLNDARQEVADVEQELADAKKELLEAEAELNDAKAELSENQTTLDDAKRELDSGWADYHRNLQAFEETIAAQKAQLSPEDPAYEAMLAALAEQEAAGKAQLQAVYNTLLAAEREYESGRQAYEEGLAQYEEGLAEYEQGKQEYEEAEAEAAIELADARQEIADGEQELSDLSPCEWYVLGRDTNAGLVNYSQDAQRVANLAAVFPVIFFVVAALACLTTMTRMVEEQRTQIGCLKALGYSRLAISGKYLGYAASASFLGGVIGLIIGSTLIPSVIAEAFTITYTMPPLMHRPQPILYAVAVLAAVVLTTGAGLSACFATLMDTPANLMRPKAPKAGKRVLLERVTPLWSRLSFIWKVTIRNLLRYKRRFWMTVLGIGGCTALIVTGFGLHDSIFSILDQQYDKIFLYDASLGIEEDMTAEHHAAIVSYLDHSEYVADYLFTGEDLVELSTDGISYQATLFAVSDAEQFTEFIHLQERQSGESLSLPDDGILLSEKTAELLHASVGDTITIEGEKRVTVPVKGITENYVQHFVYLTSDTYEKIFGTTLGENTILLRYHDTVDEAGSNETSTALIAMDGVSSYTYVATIRDTFTHSMDAINYAVVIIIVSAAALAFVVLYNLTNINITERMRELATLKVLGFYDKEITAYVYRENFFLTIFGILLGLLLGRFLHSWMVLTVEIDLVMFGRTAPLYAYGLAALMTLLFSLIVNIAAHFQLKSVHMVESLKTNE